MKPKMMTNKEAWKEKKTHSPEKLHTSVDKNVSNDSNKGRIDIGDIKTDAEITLIDETHGRINDIIADEDITLIPKLIIKLLKIKKVVCKHPPGD
ncbi:hypothetical protein Tco_1103731 [Tanacetum coccineum]